jgi:hypothetical protein
MKSRFQMVFLHNVLPLLVNANVFPSLQILVTLMMEVICSSETSDLTRVTLHNIPGGGIIHSRRRRDNLKSYIALTDWVM